MGISANSSSLRDASAITPILDSAESVAEQVMGGRGTAEYVNRCVRREPGRDKDKSQNNSTPRTLRLL